MAGNEVGVKVRQEHVRDAQAVFLGIGDILVDVALGVDDGGRVRPSSPMRYEACARQFR